MFLLMPTCDTHARAAEISAALLGRYWPGHPPLHVMHYRVAPRIDGAHLHDCGPQEQSPWLATLCTFLRGRTEELFLLLLDDYATCAPARGDIIDAAAQLLRVDPTVGIFALSWYPARLRTIRASYSPALSPQHSALSFVTLTGAPILLQAAIWRRDWFLKLADRIDARASPWGFEAAATHIAKQIPREICAADIPEPAYVGGDLVDAFDKTDWPLPYHNLMHRGRPQLQYEPFLHREGFSFPSRGLGDTLAKLARATGAARVAEALASATGRDCGCNRRREALNQRVPYNRCICE